jgi:hypothetical protein
MYIYDHHSSRSQSRSTEQRISLRPVQRNSSSSDRIVRKFLKRGRTKSGYVWAREGLGQSTTDELSQKLKFLSLLPHFTAVSGKYVPLTPSVMDPKIYDASENYKMAPKLQDYLKDVMKKANFRPIKVALVDLTKGLMQPEFPELNSIFRPILAGGPIEFGSTGENEAQLQTIVDVLLLKKESAALEQAKNEVTAAASKDAATRAAAKNKLEEAKQELERQRARSNQKLRRNSMPWAFGSDWGSRSLVPRTMRHLRSFVTWASLTSRQRSCNRDSTIPGGAAGYGWALTTRPLSGMVPWLAGTP